MLWYRYFGYALFYAAGFRIKIIGKQATRKEAPILVGAPHSSFLEVRNFSIRLPSSTPPRISYPPIPDGTALICIYNILGSHNDNVRSFSGK